MKVLVTGATGYVGGRLVPKLLEAGHTVRVIAREPHRLDNVPWRDDVDIVQGDLLNADDVRAAVAGQEALYYLVHSMSSAGDFEELERTVANTVATKQLAPMSKELCTWVASTPMALSRDTWAREKKWGTSCFPRVCPLLPCKRE